MNLQTSIRLILALLAVSAGAHAAQQEKHVAKHQVPQAVHAAFEKAYPNAKDVKYEEETVDGKPVYEIEFKQQGKELEASYAPDGTLIETEEEIKTSELPKAVSDTVKEKHPGALVKEAEKVLKPDGTLFAYEVEIKKGKEVLELELDAAGTILKTEPEKEDEGE